MNRVVGYGLILSTLFLTTAAVLGPTGCDDSPKTGTGGAAGAAAGGAGAAGASGTAGATGTAGAAGGTAAGGATGDTGGAAGGTAGDTGGAGGTAPFGAIGPSGDVFQACTSASEFVSNTTTIAYGGPSLTYTPPCLKVAAGTAVTFSPASTGDSFSAHPLKASTYGTHPSPIMAPATGSSATFTFTAPGFYAYYCNFHGTNEGLAMAGVIWVQ